MSEDSSFFAELQSLGSTPSISDFVFRIMSAVITGSETEDESAHAEASVAHAPRAESSSGATSPSPPPRRFVCDRCCCEIASGCAVHFMLDRRFCSRGCRKEFMQNFSFESSSASSVGW